MKDNTAYNPRLGKYLTRESYYQSMIHSEDIIKNAGYDWRGNLMNKTLSRYLLNDPKRSQIIEQLQALLVYMVDQVSMIKKAMNYTVDKNYKYLN
jgi:hypothetical protein